jgi:hypothetical protein
MASKGNILRGHSSEPAADYEKSLPDAALTVGTISRALADSKAALASTHVLDDRLDDVDELLDDLAKSSAVVAEAIRSIEAGSKAAADQIAKLTASLYTPGLLAKLADWEEAHLARLHKAHGHGSTLEEFKEQMAADSESFRKRDALTKYDFDDDGVLTFERRPDSQWRIVR